MRGTQLQLTGNPESPPTCLCVSILPVLKQDCFFLYSVVLPWSTVYGLMREGDGLTFKLKDDHPATVSESSRPLEHTETER